MKKQFLPLLLGFLITATTAEAQNKRKFEGTVSNGMKGDKISFVLSADGKKIEDFTFTGYWRCSGKLESIIAGPDAKNTFKVADGKITGVIVEPPGGGSTAWRFELNGNLNGKQASGTFRMNINALGCDSYLLKWTAAAK